MADDSRWTSDTLGGQDDVVRLMLDGQDVQIAEHYEVKIGYLTVPSSFAVRVGHDGVVKDITKKYAPNAPFQVFIGGALQMTGATDSVSATEEPGSIVTVEGRDALATLHDSYVEEEKKYSDVTYFDFVASNLDELGLDYTLFPDAAAMRKVQTGVRAYASSAEPTAKIKVAVDEGTTASVVRILQSRLGERRYEFVKKHLDRAGLFLRATPDGNFVLSSPAGDQKPLYRVVRRRTRNAKNEVSVRLAEFRASSAPPRYTECVIFARHGGRKYKRAAIKGGFVDDEMFNDRTRNAAGEIQAYGVKGRALVVRDANVYSIEQASSMARRKLAEGRRTTWRLSYIATGHTAPALVGGGRAVWTPDTTVHVVDEQLGFDEVMWIESVTHRRSPQTETVITLMRLRDLIFGADSEE